MALLEGYEIEQKQFAVKFWKDVNIYELTYMSQIGRLCILLRSGQN